MKKGNKFSLRGDSVIHSWQWCKQGFEAAYEWLLRPENTGTGEVLCDSRDSKVYRVGIPQEFGGGEVVRKVYIRKRLIRYLFRPSLAWREMRGYHVAASLGIPVAEVLGCRERRGIFRLYSAEIVTGFLSGMSSGLVFRGETPYGKELLMRFLYDVIGDLAKLHAAGFRHGGAHPRNFMWRLGAGGELEVIWIDTASLRPIHRRTHVRELRTDVTDLVEYYELDESERAELIDHYLKIYDCPEIHGYIPPLKPCVQLRKKG